MGRLYVYLKNGETITLTNVEDTNVLQGFLYVETKEKGQVNQYSFNLSELIYIHLIKKRVKKEI